MVELMVVILIMAVLGLAIVPSLIGSADKSKYSRAWSDLNAISNAFVALYGREGTIPAIESTVTEITGLASLQSFLGTPIDKLYDPWGNPYQIKAEWNGSKGHIIVYVKGPGTGDGESGTAKFGSVEVTGVRLDPYNKVGTGTDAASAPMAKLVIDIK